MPGISGFFRSFSFRAGFVIFLAVSALLLGQRVLIYSQTIDTTIEDIQLIIDAHEEEMDEEAGLHGTEYLARSLATMSENMRDKHLYMLLRRNGKLTGNLSSWPEIHLGDEGYMELHLPAEGKIPPLHLLASVSEYDDAELIVAYDLKRVDAMRSEFVSMIIDNLLLSFAVSLIISALIIWLLSRYFRRFNIACERVMDGNLNYRIATRGARDEFDKLAANLNRMLDWIKALISTFKDSSNAIAHDMRTPLSHLRLELRALMEREGLDDPAREQVAAQVARLDGIIEMFENMLNIAKAESRAATELFVEIDMTQLVRDVLEFYTPVIEEKRLKLTVSLPSSALMLKADKQMLGQAVVNLIDNACKYTSETGSLSVTLTQSDGYAVLAVADNGAGIPQELREKVKERFFRLDSSRNTAGHGLGLSLATAVAGLHQGTLRLLDNEPGLKAVLTLRQQG